MLSQLLPRTLRRPLPVVVPRPRAEEAGDDAPTGCGWFDSSHDLHQGLCVRELDEPAALARELPLPAWIDLQLAACAATHSAARR
jgi:hypothetical protein